jgi:hypothetical protein
LWFDVKVFTRWIPEVGVWLVNLRFLFNLGRSSSVFWMSPVTLGSNALLLVSESNVIASKALTLGETSITVVVGAGN